jgi:hypothetical protein
VINSPIRRPRLETFMDAALREGSDDLDLKKL